LIHEERIADLMSLGVDLASLQSQPAAAI